MCGAILFACGLVRIASMPASRQARRSSANALAVSAMMGISRFAPGTVPGAVPAGVACLDQDVFVNAVGGVRIAEPGADLAVTLVDGSYHNVDSSDAAFQAAAKPAKPTCKSQQAFRATPPAPAGSACRTWGCSP